MIKAHVSAFNYIWNTVSNPCVKCFSKSTLFYSPALHIWRLSHWKYLLDLHFRILDSLYWCAYGFKTFAITRLRKVILAHWIRISETLPWDRKSHLTHAILTRLSHEGYIHWFYWNSRTWSSSDVSVMLKWRYYVKLHLSVFRDFWF